MDSRVVTEARIGELLLEVLNVEISSAKTDLVDTGVLDSLALVEVFFRIEQEFGIDVSLSDFEIEDFRSIGSITEFVRRQT
jgi:acyl carrier protein